MLAAALLAACSPKVRPVAPAVKKPEPTKAATVVLQPPPPREVRTSVISLLLPFNLDALDLSAGADRANLKKADIAVEYYQGFKLAIDSLTALSYNYKLQVFDTKEENPEVHNLALNPKVRNSDLIVGPVYPEGIKYFTAALGSFSKTSISPLSPAPPEEINAPNLITVVPPLEYHAWAAAAYIKDDLKPKKVFILKSGFSEENKYTIPFKKAMDSLSKRKIKVVPLVVTRGNLKPLLAQFSKTEPNVFLVPSVNQKFLMAALYSLDTLSKHYPVTLFGHPNWEKFAFLKPELLQHLNTRITSSYRVDYKNAATVKFVKAYRKLYRVEPTDYAIKGFDEGMVFGELIASDIRDLKKLDSKDFNTLHNTFHFVNKPGAGWINTHVSVLKYENFELKPVE